MLTRKQADMYWSMHDQSRIRELIEKYFRLEAMITGGLADKMWVDFKEA